MIDEILKTFMLRIIVILNVIPYVTPPINNPEKKGNIHDLVMEISKDILKPGRNITGDQIYSTIDIVEELYQKKTTYSSRKKQPMSEQ